MIRLPDTEQVIQIHRRVIDKTGGSHGVRSEGLIESAVSRGSAGFGDIELYPSAALKAAAICEGLITNHGFVDGNKRIGIVILLMILYKNGIQLRYSQRELVELGLDIAQDHGPVEVIAKWIEAHRI